MVKLIKNIYKMCKNTDNKFTAVLIKYVYTKIKYKKNIIQHQKVLINGVENIYNKEILSIGVGYIGFMHKTDKTYLNIKGKLLIKGKYSIGRGCRFDIGENATITIGEGGYVNPNTTFIIMHKLSIGDNCAISWNCQFLDEDFHSIAYGNKKETNNEIQIGNHVWIGCGVQIYKGTIIPDGCVIASNAVVRGVFTEKNTIIGGFPARVIRKKIIWN